MRSERIQRGPYLRLLLLAALLGVASAIVTFIFTELVALSKTVLWDEALRVLGFPAPVFTIAACTAGGLLIGVLVKVFGDHSGIFAEMMQEFGRTGRFHYRQAPGMVITAFVSLAAGASLGPEAPMADACGSMGTWISERLKLDERETRALGFSGLSGMLAAFITSPFGGALLGLESARAGFSQAWTLFPSLVSSGFGTVAFVLLSGQFFGSLYVFPEYHAQLRDLFLAVPLGLLGGLAGGGFIIAFRALRRAMRPLKQHLILRGLIGGLALGVAGALFPLVLFSGEEQTLVLIDTAGQIAAAALVVLAVVKLVITSLCLATGWKGGYIFPTMFAGVALGMAAHMLFPQIPLAVAVAATMGGAMVATMKAPLFAALFTLTLVQKEVAPVIAIAVIVGLLATARLSMTPSPAPQAPEPGKPVTAPVAGA